MTKTALVIGAGPAGLMAAQVLAEHGLAVTIVDAKPSPARKFLMAGKSGLNLTKDEPLQSCLGQYSGTIDLGPIVSEFGPEDVIQFAKGLDQQVFTGSSRRVFPTVMKASPLLRAWMQRLNNLGVDLRSNCRWDGVLGQESYTFQTPQGAANLTPNVCILALGGASWARLGSDGKWVSPFKKAGVSLAPFLPSNVGFQVNWSAHMAQNFGAPLKSIRLSAGNATLRGECVITQTGLEGSAIYALTPQLREGADLRIDLMPDLETDVIARRLAKRRAKDSLTNHLRKSLKLNPAKIAILRDCVLDLNVPVIDLARCIKAVPVPIIGSNPIDQAISTAGGVMQDALDDGLMLRQWPAVFCAGEMLDWDAPTGGYLITACLATGRWAGRAAAQYALGSN